MLGDSRSPQVNPMYTLGMRRNFLKAMARMVGIFAAEIWCGSSRAQAPNPMPSPNAPRNQNIPGGLENTPVNNASSGPVRTTNHEQIAASVQLLYRLALDLKNEVERTNLSMTLPIDFVRKAQDIEKLAKQIKQNAKG